jgi:hypothetical protein
MLERQSPGSTMCFFDTNGILPDLGAPTNPG